MPVSAPSGNRFPLPALVGAGLLAASLIGVGLAAALTGGDDERPQAQTVTTARTETVVTTAPATTQQQPPPPPPTGGAGARALTDQATNLMKQGRYEEALPIAQRALQQLQGTGETYEGYANYNVGRSLVELDRCDEALPYLDRREQLLGPHPEVRAARRKCGVR